MPWNPSETNQIPGILMQTGSSIGSAIGGGISKWQEDEERKKKELEQLEQKRYIADAIMADAAKRNLVSKQELIDYRSAPQRKQVDMAFGIQAQGQFAAAAEQERQQKEMFVAKLAQMTQSADPGANMLQLSPEERAAAEQAGMVPLRTSRGQVQYVPDPTKLPAKEGKEGIGPMDKLNNDVKTETGLGLGEWNSASKKRVNAKGESDPAGEYVAAQYSAEMGKSKTAKMPVSRFEHFTERYDRILGETNTATAAGAAKPLTRDVAAALLQQAGGDKAKARALAKERGYTF